jgi:phage terminase large subunit-like protein
MGDIVAGDVVYDIRGLETRARYVSPIYFNHKCYEVRFSDGTKIVADAEHEWFTWTKAARKAFGRATNPRILPSVVTTEQIASTLHSGKDINHSIECVGIQGRIVHLPIDPYALGVWLGDGDSASAAITTEDPEVLSTLESLGHHISAPYGRDLNRYGVRDMHTKLRHLDLLNNKHIPRDYLRSSYVQRLHLLQGLLDSYGHINLGGHAEFTSVKENLARQTLELVNSLGIKATMITGRATLNGRDCGPKYRVCFTPYIPTFRLPRKAKRIKTRGNQGERQRRRYIVAVDQVESVPVRCIGVDSPTHLFLASRSFIPTHNTRTAAEWVREQVEKHPRGAFVGPTAGDVRDTMVEGESGILSVFPDHQKPKYEPSKRRITFHTGCVVTCFSAERPDRLRGPENAFAWAEELAAWQEDRRDLTFQNLKFGLRIGRNPQCIITTTPKPLELLRKIQDNPKTHLTTGSTYENIRNLAAGFIEDILSEYEGTTIGQQEIYGLLLEETEGALWSRKLLERTRVQHDDMPTMSRIVVAVDPPAKKVAECGIVVVGLGVDRHLYVIADWTVRGSPKVWSDRVVSAYETFKANWVVAEVNQGGDMVEEVLRNREENLPYRGVHATRGKQTRAEPVVTMFERGDHGHAHMVGTHEALEGQLVNWLPTDEKSPDRLDAMVWGCVFLSKGLSGLTRGRIPRQKKAREFDI